MKTWAWIWFRWLMDLHALRKSMHDFLVNIVVCEEVVVEN